MPDQIPNYKRLLGIDYGTKRIGLALTDPLKTFAYSFKTIPNDARLLDEISQIISEQEIEKIILGLPLKENGLDSSLTPEVKKFKMILEDKFNLEIIFYDERYSSSIALDQIMESTNKKMKRQDKTLIDKGAAAVILQDYLNGLTTNAR